MNAEEETDHLLPETDTQVKRKKYRYVPLEIVAFLNFLPIIAMIPIQQFYVIDQISEKYGQPSSVNEEKNYCPKNISADANNTNNKIQSESANILMYLTFFSTLLSVVPILVMGAIADRFGRKLPLIVSMFGVLLKEIVIILTVYKGLSLWILILGEFFQGITGHFGASLAALMGMIADITNPGKTRAIRISILEGSVAITMAFTTVGIGYWIRNGNYTDPLIFCISCTVFAIIFALFVLPETYMSDKRVRKSLKIKSDVICACFKLYKSKVGGRRNRLIFGQILFCINVAAVLGKSNVQTLFLLNHPLCWTEVHVQLFNCIQFAFNWILIVAAIKLLHRCMHDYTIVIIGTISAIAASITFGFGEHDWIIYMSVPIGVMANSISPMMRSLLSRLVSPDEQGSLFASIGSSELLFTSLAQLAYGYIYQASLSLFPGLVFMVVAGTLLIAFCLSLVLCRLMSKEPVPVEEIVVEA